MISGLGIREAVQELIAGGKICIRKDYPRIHLDRLLRFFYGLFMLAEDGVNLPRQKSVGQDFTRISLRPQLKGLLRLLQISRHLLVISSGDKKLLAVAGAIPQLIGLGGALRGETRFSQIAVSAPQE